MSEQTVFALLRQTMITALTVGGPLLLAALVVGLLVGLVLAVTQIQEPTLTFLPKAIVLGLVLLLLGPMLFHQMEGLLTHVIEMLPQAAR